MQREKQESLAAGGPYLRFMDGLRGVSILAVLLAHTARYAGFGPAIRENPVVRFCFFSGRTGVQLFFMLSAFLLFLRMKSRLGTERRATLCFYTRRAFRILPFWWITVLLYCLWTHRPVSSVLPELFMYFGFFQDRPNLFDAQWSIFVEESFYVLLPWFFVTFSSTRKTVWSFLILWLFHLAWMANGGSEVRPPAQWFGFALGILIFHFYERSEVFEKIIGPTGWLAVDILVLLLAITLLPFGVPSATLGWSLVFIVSIFPQSLFGKVARSRVLGLFGTYAYSIYLLHLLVISILTRYQARFINLLHLTHAHVLLIFFACFSAIAAVMLLVGHLCFRTIETSSIRLGRRVIAWIESPSRISGDLVLPTKTVL